MAYSEIYGVTLPSGTTYQFKDKGARDLIDKMSGYTKYLGVTTTELTDGSTTNPIDIGGVSIKAVNGDIANYGSKEFIFNGTAWQEFGDLSGLGDLAFKDSASGSITPAGTISAPSVSVSLNTTTIKSVSDVGTLPTLTTSVTDEILTIGFSQGTLPTVSDDITVGTSVKESSATAPTFTGTEGTVTVS